MTDELDRLRAAIQAADPAPDEGAKARALALAQKNFAARQGTAETTRPKDTAPENPAGFLTGVKNMFQTFGLRPALYATSSLAVLGLGIILILPVDNLFSPTQIPASLNTEAEIAAGLTPQETDDAPAMEMPDVDYEVAEPAPLALQAPQKAKLTAESTVVGAIASANEERVMRPSDQNERFANTAPNPLKITAEEPISTFSIDVDTASYAYLRAAITGGTLPDPDAVRIEEMINYFPYDYAAPEGDVPFSTNVSVFQTPWNPDTRLVHIGIQGEKPAIENRPPLNLVFLIDTSGSMQYANKLPLLKQSFRLLLSRLNPDDQVAIVTYAGSSGVVMKPTAASETGTILAALDRLEAGGSTAGAKGLQLAYLQAERMADEGRVGRIILATDGDFNVGISDPEDLKQYVEKKRESGIYLSVLGFGRGNYNDALMQVLAQNGNGTASYIDTLAEAQKVLVDQVSGALFPIANDVKIQVEFNPAKVAEYRLIGYETRILAREDFNNDKVDAGDIGAGHNVTAIYEITPVGSPAQLSDPLRYAEAEAGNDNGELGFLKLRYKAPGQSESRLIETPISSGESTPSQDAEFAAAIAGFGQLLRGGKYLGDWQFSDAIALANRAKGADPFGYRAEAVTLMRLAESLSR